MREDETNWFPKFTDELPSSEELMPLSQSLISPNLALAFNIPTSNHRPSQLVQTIAAVSSQPASSCGGGEFESSPELMSGGGGGGDEPARTLKRPRLVWTPQLHKRFVDAVAHLGIKNAVPKTIMQLMSVDGLTRENVASHLQKYRLYLKRMQGISNSNTPAATCDPATDHLFANSPVPTHFLQHPGTRSNSSDHFLPTFVPAPPPRGLLHHASQFRQFGTAPVNGQFEHPFVRQSQAVQRMGMPVGNGSMAAVNYVEELEGRKVLTLFPTMGGDD